MADVFAPAAVIESGANYKNVFKSGVFISTYPPGIELGKSFLFDGSNELFTGNSNFDSTWNTTIGGASKKFTVCFWYKKTAPSVTGAIICRDNVANRQFIVQKTSTNRIQITVYTDPSNSLQYISNNINADTGNFVFYCFTYDGTLGTVTDRITLYRNGVLDVGPTVSQTGTFTNINTNTTPGIQVGGRSSSLQPLNGNIHSVALFNTNLSGAQNTSLYNSGTPFDFRQATFSSNLVSYIVAGNGTNFGAQWTWTDLIISGATFTSQNMELADLVNDAP